MVFRIASTSSELSWDSPEAGVVSGISRQNDDITIITFSTITIRFHIENVAVAMSSIQKSRGDVFVVGGKSQAGVTFFLFSVLAYV